MKMQNAEIELVTFDAQDVLMTSGTAKWQNDVPGVPNLVYFSGSIVNSYNSKYSGFDFGGATGQSPNDTNYYVYSSEYYPGKDSGDSWGALAGQDESWINEYEPSAQKLSSLTEVVSWLAQHGHIAQ